MSFLLFTRLGWRLFVSHVCIGRLVLMLGSFSILFMVDREVIAFHRREVAHLSNALSRPDVSLSPPGEPPRAYLLRAGVSEALLIDQRTLDLVRRGGLTPELYQVRDEPRPGVFQSGQRRPLPPVRIDRARGADQYLLTALRELPADHMARVVIAGKALARPRFDPAGRTVIFAPLPESGPVNALLVVAIRPGMVDALLQTARRWLWVAGAAVLALAALLAWVLARSISGPLRELGRVAELASRGDLSQRVPAYHGEIGAVARIFNQALDQMAEARSNFQLAEEARRDLVASVSHEFRAPLASLRGYLELIGHGLIKAEELGRYVDVMLEDAFRLNRLVEDLLDLARIQARQVSLDLVRLDAAEAVHRVVEQASSVVGSGITLVAEPQPDLPAVLADRDRLDQVLANLVENALRYAAPDGWVRVSAEGRGERVAFSVSDSGPGIALPEQARIWDRFYKLDRARTPGTGGTGLGLAIVKELVEAMGGEVGLISAPGRGSTFWFTIPAEGHQAQEGG